MKFHNKKDGFTIVFYKNIFSIFLLFAWSGFQYSQGNKFYSFFIIVFFASMFFLKQYRFFIVSVSVLLVVLFRTPVVDTWQLLRGANIIVLENPGTVLKHIFTPNSGRDVLPVEVQQMLSLLETHHLTSYQLSNLLEEDVFLNQRIIESSWPIKKENTSLNLFLLQEEVIDYPTCMIVDNRKDVLLGYCR